MHRHVQGDEEARGMGLAIYKGLQASKALPRRLMPTYLAEDAACLAPHCAAAYARSQQAMVRSYSRLQDCSRGGTRLLLQSAENCALRTPTISRPELASHVPAVLQPCIVFPANFRVAEQSLQAKTSHSAIIWSSR